MDQNQSDPVGRVKGLVGAAILGALLTGVIALGFVLFGTLTNALASGLALIAAAIAFTGVANAILRR